MKNFNFGGIMEKDTITKKKISNELSESYGFTQAFAMQIVNSVLDYMRNNLVEGNRIELHDLGVFLPVVRKEKKARNIKTGDTVIVPERNTIKFKPSKKLIEQLN